MTAQPLHAPRFQQTSEASLTVTAALPARHRARARRAPASAVAVALAVSFALACSDDDTDTRRPDAGVDGGADGGARDAGGEVMHLETDLVAFDEAAILSGNLGLMCDDPKLEARVAALVAKMSLSQKIHEMHGLRGTGRPSQAGAGGDAALDIPTIWLIDGPRGLHAGTATAFPVGQARGATFDPTLEKRVGEAIGEELRARGGDMLLAPTINLLRHPGWGRAQETYSEDPFHMGRMAVGFISGVQQHALASAKHFAGNSIENTRFAVSVNLDERTLRELYLPHFFQAVTVARTATVMSAYNRVNGTYCGEHPHLLRGILKDEWGFRGFVESDYTLGTRSTGTAINAGLDVEMPVDRFFTEEKIRAAIDSGEVDEARIDEAVTRVLRMKLCFDIDGRPRPGLDVIESDAHRALAREVAEKSIVLLRNEGQLLPLDAKQKQRIAVVGALADTANLGDRGSSRVISEVTVSPLAGLKRATPAADWTEVVTDTPSASEWSAIESADTVVIVAGLTYLDEGEYIPVAAVDPAGGMGAARGGDRASLALPEAQRELIREAAKRHDRVIVVLEAGSAITMHDWLTDVEAVLMAWYPGLEGGSAIASVLFGTVNPSGRLPVTFPVHEAQLPDWDIKATEVTYDLFHGYRLFDRDDETPEFPFGFGLGYTTFEVLALETSARSVSDGDVLEIAVDVRNTGTRPGEHVVQLYVAPPTVAVLRAEKQLQGFARVALAPGESRRVRFDVATEDLRRYDEDTSAWVLDPGEYGLLVGHSASDLPLEGSFRVR